MYGELTAEDIIGAAEVLAPEAMADDSDGTIRLGGAVVGWCEHPATECRHAEHVEEAPADIGAVHGHPSTALRNVEALTRPGEGAVEEIRFARLDLLPDRVGPRSGGEEREASWIPHSQRAHDEAVEDREQRRIGADPERERTDHDGGEALTLA